MTPALEGGEWSATCSSCTLPLGKARYPFYGRLGEPKDRSGQTEHLVPTRIRSLDHPARSQSLYQLSCPDLINVLSYIHINMTSRLWPSASWHWCFFSFWLHQCVIGNLQCCKLWPFWVQSVGNLLNFIWYSEYHGKWCGIPLYVRDPSLKYVLGDWLPWLEFSSCFAFRPDTSGKCLKLDCDCSSVPFC